MKRLVKLILLCMALLTMCTTALAADDEQAKENDKNVRYVKLFTDNSFNYYMDKTSAQWIKCPNTSDEYIIDVWIKMDRIEEDNAQAAGEGEQYSYPTKYYLEHYYMRPSTKQVQFLCELEVTGRPDNNIRQREYDVKNWEYLIPDSIEDNIYQGVVNIMGEKHNANGKGVKGVLSSAGDLLEDVFRISI